MLQGIATGAATSAFTAAIIELAPAHRKRLGALIGSVTPAAGLGVGALFAGAVAELAPGDPAIVWGILLVVMAAGIGIALFVRETVTPTGGALASLRPRIAVPARARTAFGAGVPSLIGAWMVAALFMGLMPTILGTVFGIHDVLTAAITAAIEPIAAGVAAWLLGRVAPRTALLLGGGMVIVGTAVDVAGILFATLPLLWVGGVLGGIGFGAVFSGTVRGLAPLAEAHERAGLFAAIFVVAYLAFGVPAIVAGQLVAPLGLLAVAVGFAAVILLTATIGLVSEARRRS